MALNLRSSRRLSTFLKPHFLYSSTTSYSSKSYQSRPALLARVLHSYRSSASSRDLCFRHLDHNAYSQGPAAIDYSSLLQEDEFHKLADSTIHDLQEKFEEYGDSVQVDGFDIDYGNEVLTLKLGDLGTYVLNKQTPNRQLWLSSPVSGPSRFDWDRNAKAWIYRRTKAKLLNVFESELEQLCGEPIKLA
ncbi:frataxin, mitochondrial [Mercurialis annua]|uniref:frataxin, mitochondrial n=1 Tax=Mercurialis annua TaxID=3986 RepID=UPI00215E8A07|nr:frataxin, mitochondrial [Mercurialis annua]